MLYTTAQWMVDQGYPIYHHHLVKGYYVPYHSLLVFVAASHISDVLIWSLTWGKRLSTTVPAKGFAGFRSLNAPFLSRPAGFREDFEDNLVKAFDREEFDFGPFLWDQAAGSGSDFCLPVGILTIESFSFTSSSRLSSPCKNNSAVWITIFGEWGAAWKVSKIAQEGFSLWGHGAVWLT